MPVAWDDLAASRAARNGTSPPRASTCRSRPADPWAGYWKTRQSLAEPMKRLGYVPHRPWPQAAEPCTWKGAITFGLVHIPVGLHTASTEQGVDFDWLDKRSMDPVGYKRINKKTGKEIDKDNIVKGVEYEDGKYVVISPDEIEAVYPRTTQTIEIQRFIDANEIPFVYLERPTTWRRSTRARRSTRCCARC
jgi:hypothetical protein